MKEFCCRSSVVEQPLHWAHVPREEAGRTERFRSFKMIDVCIEVRRCLISLIFGMHFCGMHFLHLSAPDAQSVFRNASPPWLICNSRWNEAPTSILLVWSAPELTAEVVSGAGQRPNFIGTALKQETSPCPTLSN
jgi:hypothetical protein